MSSEDVSIIALSPFVRYFTYTVIKSIRIKNLSEKRTILHADMVPKLSEGVIQASLGMKTSNINSEMKPSIVPIPAPIIEPIQKKDVNIAAPQLVQQQKPIVQNPRILEQTRVIPKPEIVPQVIQAPLSSEEGLTKFYGKITPLLNDPSISIIKCSGIGIPITVVRRGQTQLTKIVLTAEEIRQILDKVSEAAHIPLLEGVFRVTVDTFSVDAVISEMIGSRFVIKKKNPMLDVPSSPHR